MARVTKEVADSRARLQLCDLLAEEGRNQKKLAEETGIPQSVISDIMNRRRLPSLEQALAFEKFGIPASAWKEAASAKGAA